MNIKRIGILTAGGDCPGLNAVVRAVSKNALKHGIEVLGFKNGYDGLVRNEFMQGKGNVIRRMFREIDALVYVMVDGDDTYPMESAPKMVDLVLNHNSDMVVGDRLSSTYYEENKRPFHNFGNNLVRGSINRLFNCNQAAYFQPSKSRNCQMLWIEV